MTTAIPGGALAVPAPYDNHVFIQARNDFLDLLSPSEKADLSSCLSIEDLILKLEKFQHISNGGSRIKRSLEKVKALGDNLQPYFKIMEIFCGAHPEWANIALGSLQLVLQLASNFATFFEKLCDVVETLNLRLPRYQEVYDTLAKQPTALSTSLKSSFQRLYSHLFEFYGAVARIFSKKCGKLKRTSIVATSLMWQPFDVRFQTILQKLKLDQQIVQEELQFASMGNLKTAMENAAVREREAILASLSTIETTQNEHARQNLRSLATKWLSPPDYKAALEQAQEHRVQGTNEWLQNDPRIALWRSASAETDESSSAQDRSQLIWICGNPGSGKTVLAASTIHELKKNHSHLGPDCLPEVCYYFFSQNFSTRNSPVDAYRAIATQLFDYFNNFEKISNLYALGIGNGATLQKAPESEVVDTISQCLPHLPHLFFVIDAIDECSHSDRLLRQLSKWCESSPLKAVVLSRPDVAGLRRRIPKDKRIELRGAEVDADIARYLELEIEALVEEDLLSEDVDQAEIVSHLVARAEGMFLWARLIIGYLNEPAMTRAQRLATILEKNTEGLDQLDEMYKRIEARINSMKNPYSKRLSQNSLMWVAHVAISSDALKDALSPLFPEGLGWDVEPKGVSEKFDLAVIVGCGGLVEKGPHPGGCFRYIHLTALEFVQRANSLQRDTGEPLIPNATVSKALIATRCISFLEALPQRPLSGRLGEAASHSTVLGQWPLLRIATEWMGLSVNAVAATNDSSTTTSEELLKMTDLAYKFLKNRLSLMVWVEAWYNLCTSPSKPQHATTARFTSLRDRLVNILTRNQNTVRIEHYLSNLRGFINDMIQLHAAWGLVLTSSPHDIWGDVTVFTKSQFFVSTKAAHAQCLAPEMASGTDIDANKAVKPTFSISMSSADGRQLAVLAIFPSESFRKGWEELTDIPSIQGSFKWDRKPTDPPLSTFPQKPVTLSEFQMASSGWLATYEISSVLETCTKSIHQSTICLQACTVELCLRQCLRFSPVGCWKCSFPLTIAPGLGLFSILNTVYHFNAGLNGYVGAQIPTSFDARLERSWQPETRRVLSYSYNLSWSPDSRYLAFADLEMSAVGDIGDPACIAVFSVPSNWVDNQNLILVKVVSLSTSWVDQGTIMNSQFHPTNPFFLFTMGKNIFIWRFQEQPSPTRIQGLPTLLHDGSTVGFSHCGTAIAIIQIGRRWPEFVPLSSVLPELSRLPSSARKRVMDDTGDVSRPIKRPHLLQLNDIDSNKNRSVATALDQIPSVLSTTSLVALQGQGVGTNGSVTIVNSKSRPNQINVVYGNEDSANKLSICNLPSHIPLRSASVDIMMQPSSCDTGRSVCTLAVNSKSAPVYESDEREAAENLPVVVWKDTLALRVNPWSGHLIEGNGLEEWNRDSPFPKLVLSAERAPPVKDMKEKWGFRMDI